MGIFEITVKNLHWLDNMEEAEDRCAHGEVRVQIGNEIFESKSTVSATALYLLKSIEENHIIYKDIQMLPCCGFFIIPNEDLTNVVISGCPNGIDWSIIHEGNNVKLITGSGKETKISISEYTQEVYKFADEIEEFYKRSTPKVLPNDEFDKNGYIAFWNEWNKRRNE